MYLPTRTFIVSFFFLFALFPSITFGKIDNDDDKKPAIRAIVQNKFTGEKIDSITLTVMEMDSTIVQSSVPRSFYKWSVYDSVERTGKFIFKFSKEGYFDAYVNASSL